MEWRDRGEGDEKANHWWSNEGVEICLGLGLLIHRGRDHDRDLASF